MQIWQIPQLVQQQALDYAEFLQIPVLSLGIYKLAVGSEDTQTPHREDEAYYVVHGRAKIIVADEVQPVHPGTLVFVPANVEHRFFDIEEDLTLLVIFAPAHTG